VIAASDANAVAALPPAAAAGVLIPLLIDDTSNGFQDAYAAWPIRWYLFTAEDSADSGHGSVVPSSVGSAGTAPRVVVSRIGEPDDASFDGFEIQLLLDSIATGEFSGCGDRSGAAHT
jgi:hypothetical protein